MADKIGLWLQLKAMYDKNQIKRETEKAQKEAQKNMSIELKADKKQLEKDLKLAYKELEMFKKQGDKEGEIQVRANIKELEGNLKEVEKSMDTLGVKAKGLGGTLQNLATKFVGYYSIGKAISYATEKFNEYQQSQAKIVQATGATGEALRGLTKDMLEVQGTVNQNQGEIAEAVGELNTRLGLTGKELQDFTTQYLKFAKITGQDGKEAIAENVRLFNIWGVETKEQTEYLDKLAKAGQLSGVNVGQLTQQLTDNQAILSELGFSLDESIALLSNFEKAGIDASGALAAMKIGMKNFLEDGKSPSEALQEIVDKINNAESATVGMGVAFEVFGARGGQQMFNAIKNGTLDVEGMTKALEEATGTVNDTHEAMETFAEFINRKWNGLVASFIEWNDEGFNSVRQLVNIIGEKLQPAVNNTVNHLNKWKIATEGLLSGERKFQIIEGKLYSVITEKGKAMEIARRKQEALNQTTQEYVDTADVLNKEIKDFDNTSIDDSKTREEFEASRDSALDAAQAFQEALASKIAYTKGEIISSGGNGPTAFNKDSVKQALNLKQLEAEQNKLLRTINEIQNRKYTGSGKKPSGGALGDSVLGGGGSGGSKSKAEEDLKAYEDEMKNAQNIYEDLTSQADKHRDEIKNLNKEIEKLGEQYKELQDKAKETWQEATENVKKYNDEINKNQLDSIQKLGERYVELQDKIREVGSRTAERVSGLSKKEIQNYMENGILEVNGLSPKELLEIKEVLDEIKLIEDNTTEEQRKSADFTEKKSKAQEILNSMKEKELELEQKKSIELEKQAIAEAMINQKQGEYNIFATTKDGEREARYKNNEGNWEKIIDLDNIKYAEQLYNQSKNLEDQKTQLEDEKAKEYAIIENFNNMRTTLEDKYMKVFNKSIQEQKQGYAEVNNLLDAQIEKLQEINALRGGGGVARAYGGSILSSQVATVGENGPEQVIARHSSYVQPRNASNSYSTTNTTNNNLSLNGINVGNYNTIEDLFDDLRQYLTYRN